MFVIIVFVLLALCCTFSIYYRLFIVGVCKSKVCLVGKTAIVTGANTGIGYETALDFAKRGARVILACRNEAKAQEAVARIRRETLNENVHYKLVDFASFASVRAFAKDVIATEDRLDILVNNAGTALFGKKRTKDGLPMSFQINYLSQFLLSNLLLDLLMKNPSRIVNVSSFLAKLSPTIDCKNLAGLGENIEQYRRSKLCQILFTIEFARRYADTNVKIYSVHPGFVRTNIWDALPFLKGIAHSLSLMCGKSPEEGAQTQIFCSVANGLEKYNGGHFHDCRLVKRYRNARDPTTPTLVWEASEKLISLN